MLSTMNSGHAKLADRGMGQNYVFSKSPLI